MLIPRVSLLAKAVLLSLIFSSCSKESDDDVFTTQPTTEGYDFIEAETYDYGKQRFDMLDEITAYMETGNTSGVMVSKNQLRSMYQNLGSNVGGYEWTSEVFESNQPDIRLINETELDNVDYITDWMDNLESVSSSTISGGDGVPGVVSSNDGTESFLFDASGFEPAKMVEYGLMGSVFYYKGMYFLDDENIDVDNSLGADGTNYTEMQRAWDNSFLFFGAPLNLSRSNVDLLALQSYPKLMRIANDGELSTVDNIMKLGFYRGRDAINNNNYTGRDYAINTIRKEWEQIIVTAALHHLNGAKEDYEDDALRNHQLTIAYALIRSLEFNKEKMIESTQIGDFLAKLGPNFYQTSIANLEEVSEDLAGVYNLDPLAF